MATEALAPKNPTATRFSVDDIEVAAADLDVADVMAEAVDSFLGDIREAAEIALNGQASEEVNALVCRAGTMLGLLQDRIKDARGKIDSAVDAAITDGLKRWSAK